MERYGAQQDHKRRGTGQDSPGYPQGQQAAPGYRRAIYTWRQMRMPVMVRVIIMIVAHRKIMFVRMKVMGMGMMVTVFGDLFNTVPIMMVIVMVM